MAVCVLAFTGRAGSVVVEACASIAPCVRSPAATAPPVLRKLRRSGEAGNLFMGLNSSDVILTQQNNVELRKGGPNASIALLALEVR
jgi:hypothetical protein